MSFRHPHIKPNKLRKVLLLAAFLLCSPVLWAQAPLPSSISNPFVVIMVVIMIVLAIIIGLLGYVVLGSAELYLQKYKKEEQEKTTEEKKSTGVVNVLSVVALLLVSLTSQAQDTESTTASVIYRTNLSDTAFYLMTGVIFIELIVIGALLYNLRVLLEIRSKKKAAAAAKAAGKPAIHWWDKLNKFKPVEQEHTLDTGHDYDGIRELNNRLPPWWIYGFYLTIIFAVIYLWRFHVSHTAPLSGEEYQIEVAKAEVAREEYLKKAANSVDENTVKLLTSEADLAAGQKVFQTACFACHGKQGEGGVGPNLTDNFWLHGGKINDVFKTIKYGVAEKGMKSWKDDYSPAQIAQIASFIKSLKGTNPPNGKAPQGAEETGEAAPAGDPATANGSKTSGSDSTAPATPSSSESSPAHQ